MSATSGVRPEVYAATAPPIAATAPSDTSARTSKPGDVLRRDRALMRIRAKSAPWGGASSATIVLPLRVNIPYCVVWNYEPTAAGLAAEIRRTDLPPDG